MAGDGVVTRKGKLECDGSVLRFARYTGDWMPSWGAQWSTPVEAVDSADVVPGRLSLRTWFSGGARRRLRICAGGQERLFLLARPEELAHAITVGVEGGCG